MTSIFIDDGHLESLISRGRTRSNGVVSDDPCYTFYCLHVHGHREHKACRPHPRHNNANSPNVVDRPFRQLSLLGVRLRLARRGVPTPKLWKALGAGGQC